MSNRVKNLRDNLWKQDAGLCHWCGCQTYLPGNPLVTWDNLATLDHILPAKDRGEKSQCSKRKWRRNNKCILSCQKCNNTRGDKSVEQWVKDRGGYGQNTN